MGRFVKQLIYGIFYLTIFALILFGSYSSNFKPAPSCFDGKLNQNEEEVDCGGACEACEIKKLELPQATRPVSVLKLSSGKAVLLAEVFNPNSNYAARPVAYRFQIYNRTNSLIETIEGEEKIFPLEKRYLYKFVSAAGDIGRADLEFFNPRWVKADLNVSLSVTKLETVVAGQKISAKGLIKNNSPFVAREVNAIAVIFDKFGFELFASQATIGDFRSFEEKNFAVFFPSDPALVSKIDRRATKVFFRVE